jgi:hypothetical protein
MTLKVKLLMLLMVLFALTLASAAQDENTGESPEDNACYAGGSLEGKCDWPTDAEDEWAWTCGWYIARAERGIIAESSVPNRCNYFTTAICFRSEISGPDLLMIGVPDRANNAILHLTTDGTCLDPAYAVTIIISPITGPALDAMEMAFEKCAEITDVPGAQALPLDWLDYGHSGLPEDYWMCIEPSSAD